MLHDRSLFTIVQEVLNGIGHMKVYLKDKITTIPFMASEFDFGL